MPIPCMHRTGLVGLAISLSLAACAANPPVPSEGSSSATPSVSTADSPSDAPSTTGSGAVADGYPVTIENCGISMTYEQSPERAVSLNQGSTEVMLSLELQDKMVGTAYWDDLQVSPRFAEAYNNIPIINEKWPNLEQFLAARPDFAYASYGGVFSDKFTKAREDLLADGIRTYVTEDDCEQGTITTWEDIWRQLDEIAAIFGVPERATALRTTQKQKLDELRAQNVGNGATAVWWDNETDKPFLGGGTGGPQLILDAVGLTNAFADQQKNWFNGSWEDVIAADPDWIVLIDATWGPADQKKEYLKNDPALNRLRAVQEEKYLVIPYSETTPGVTMVDGAQRLAAQLESAS
ncbi:ABC transporter substrate-binding protein [Stomatohabitans albus]|uniref:ABC transporter substrate-binding protein n=1 Tax=Stomatohabitans albus TaxID=3110766 RepID=UPI00300BFDCC